LSPGPRIGLVYIDALGIPPADWAAFLATDLDDETLETIRSGERTGRALGDAGFVKRLEATTGRQLAPHKPASSMARPSRFDVERSVGEAVAEHR
jgi:hypothetical protein